MQNVKDGQCGLCAYFGEQHGKDQQKIEQIHRDHKGPEDLVEECKQPELVNFRLQVTPISGCKEFKSAAVAVP